eukprot:2344671-Amphidinium_carterae.1
MDLLSREQVSIPLIVEDSEVAEVARSTSLDAAEFEHLLPQPSYVPFLRTHPAAQFNQRDMSRMARRIVRNMSIVCFE